MNVVFLGPPGSGKGTMAERVSARMGLAHISTGDMLRAQIKANSELGALAKSYIDKGALVPDGVIIDMMKDRFGQNDAKGGVLLDGFPRTVAQAQALDGIAVVDRCVNLVVAAEVVIDRVLARRVCDSCGKVYSAKAYAGHTCAACGGELVTRADDKEETIRERFRVYEEQTAPLIAYYTDRGILANIDATMPIDREADEICRILGQNDSH